MQVRRLADGLWWWTGRVEGRGDRASLYVEFWTSLSLLDPVVPPEDRDTFLDALDRDAERHGRPMLVHLSSESQRPLADEIVTRYGAQIVADTDDVRAVAPGMFWLPMHRTLFAADTLEPAGDGRLRITAGHDPDAVAGALQTLDIGRVVCSAGEPVGSPQLESLLI